MKRETPAQAFIVDYVCDQCGNGTMQPHGAVASWLTDPIQYPHKCTSCGHEQTFTERYPHTVFNPVQPAQQRAAQTGGAA